MIRAGAGLILVAASLLSGPAAARDLEVEVEFLHVAGPFAPQELDAALADERLTVEARYQPTRLIDGVTARRERVMPIGSRLFAIPQSLDLAGARIERQGRTLRFRVPDAHPQHEEYYRLDSVTLQLPVAAGEGRPQPAAQVYLLQERPKAAAPQETALFARQGAFDLGVRLRYRWSGATGATQVANFKCNADVKALGEGRYRFRSSHRHAGLFRMLASDVQSDPPSRPRPGRQSFRAREPLPEPIAGWSVSRNHLIRLDAGGDTVERLSVYAQQAGDGACRRSRAYEALYAGGQPVEMQLSVSESECGTTGASDHRTVQAAWLDDGTLARYMASSAAGTRLWDAFLGADAPYCGTAAEVPGAQAEAQALAAEMRRLRDAFLRP